MWAFTTLAWRPVHKLTLQDWWLFGWLLSLRSLPPSAEEAVMAESCGLDAALARGEK